MLKANFTITETGGTGTVQLQSSSDLGATWQDISHTLLLSHGALTVDDSAAVNIDTTVLIPGQTYDFRLVDTAGAPVSNIYTTNIPSITDYASGSADIDFTNTGGDNWSAGFHSSVTSLQGLPTPSIVSYRAHIDFWSALTSTQVLDDDQTNTDRTSDLTYAIAGHGAGVYAIRCGYQCSNNMGFNINRLVKVDASGNILADLQIHGINVLSASGLDITVQPDMDQVGVSYTAGWGTLDASGNIALLGQGDPFTASLSPSVIILLLLLGLDAVFRDDYDGDFFPGAQISIS